MEAICLNLEQSWPVHTIQRVLTLKNCRTIVEENSIRGVWKGVAPSLKHPYLGWQKNIKELEEQVFILLYSPGVKKQVFLMLKPCEHSKSYKSILQPDFYIFWTLIPIMTYLLVNTCVKFVILTWTLKWTYAAKPLWSLRSLV